MRSKTPHLVILLISVLLLTAGCSRGARQYEKAKALYEEGLALSDSDQSVAAAETYTQALLELEQCNQDLQDVKRLKGQIKDELGTRYWKHGLKEDALRLHQEAIGIFRSLPGSALLMGALQHAGRVAASLQRVEEAEAYYEEALQLALTQKNKQLYYEILLELGRDVLMEQGDYHNVIEIVTEALEGGARPDLCHLTLGMAYYYIENDRLAIKYLNLATQSEKAGVRMPAYQGLYLIYELQNNYPQALKCFEKYNENMMLAHREQRNEEMQRIKREYDLQLLKENMQAEQKLRSLYLYLTLGILLIALIVTLLLLRQKTLKDKLQEEESQKQMEVALKKNKVFVTALALSEKITGDTVDFNLEEKEWNDYLELIDMVYNNFTKKLMERYPVLTKTDLQICSLTRQGFNNQVISIMMNLQTNSYARRKYRIKQEKMNGAQDNRSFEEIINEI